MRHLGLMFANLAFSQDVSFEAANLLVKQFDQLTYRQLCILALVEHNGVLDVEALRRPEHEDPEIEALKREEMDLFSTDLGTFGLIADGDRPRHWSDKLSTRGAVLHRLAALNEIPTRDLEPIENVLTVLRKAYTK